MKKLGDAELEIMLAVWEAGEPVPSSYVQEKLRGRRDWALPSILTSLSRLVDKGFLTVRKLGRRNEYAAAVSEADYQAAQTQVLVNKLYAGSAKGLVAALIRQEAISPGDYEELKRFWEEGKGHA